MSFSPPLLLPPSQARERESEGERALLGTINNGGSRASPALGFNDLGVEQEPALRQAIGEGRLTYPNGYIAVGWLLFLQEQIKVIIIISLYVSIMHLTLTRESFLFCLRGKRTGR
jgi:hypothetical protein